MKSKKLIGIILAVLFLLLLYYTSPLINNNFEIIIPSLIQGMGKIKKCALAV